MKEYFLLDKEKIYYRKNDFKKVRQTLVFIHGASGSSSAWKPYENKFKNKYNILTFDLRGHGKSFRPKKLKNYSIDKSSNDLYKIVKKEKLSKFVLISHSFGNFISFSFIKKHRKFVKALILISADSAPAKRRVTSIISPLLFMSKLLGYLPVLKKEGSHIDYRLYTNTGDWNIRRFCADIPNTGLRSYFFSLYHANKADFRNLLPKIKVPVLVIHGQKDTIFPVESGKKISKAIKNSRFIVFEDSGHIIVLNNFVELSKEIDKFVRSLV